MIEQLLLYRIIQVHVLVQEQVFLEEEEMMRVLPLRVLLILLRCSVSFPLGHDVSYFLLRDQRSFGRSQHLVDRVACVVSK